MHDHHRRLHDLEVALSATLELVFRTPAARQRLIDAALILRGRAEDGAAALLVGEPRA